MANFTKPAIKASFMKLLNERPLNKISVRDIVEDCGINRNSFYYHFQDISALLYLCEPIFHKASLHWCAEKQKKPKAGSSQNQALCGILPIQRLVIMFYRSAN